MPAQPVHVRNPRTPGGGWRPADLIKLPIPVLLALAFFKWVWRHLLPVLAFGLIFVVVVIGFFDLSNAILYGLTLLLAYVLLVYAVIFCKYRGNRSIKALSKAIYRRTLLFRYWEDVMLAAEVKRKPYPKPRKLRYDRNGLTFKLKTRAAIKTSGDIAVASGEIAAALNAYEVKIDTPRPAVSIVNVSWGDPTEREIRPGDVIQTQKVNTIAPFNDGNQQAIDLPIDLSLLVVGKTGSGKSTLFWSYLEALNKKKIPYKIRAIDPAGGVELADLEDAPNTIDYLDSAEGLDNFMTRADKEMQETFRRMEAKGIRNAPVSLEFPLDIMVVDEFLMLPQMDAQSEMGKRLATGRKGNHIVFALSQLSQVDALGRVRDLFPQRMCLSVKDSSVTNAILGADAEKNGAKCSLIDNPGVGYMYVNGARRYTKFRVPMIEDEETEHIAQGGLIEAKTQTFRSNRLTEINLRRTARYKFFNDEGRLLYVGIAWNPKNRQAQHAKDKTWFPEIDHDLTEIDWFKNRKEAKSAESWSIKNEDPLYNIAEKVDTTKKRRINGI